MIKPLDSFLSIPFVTFALSLLAVIAMAALHVDGPALDHLSQGLGLAIPVLVGGEAALRTVHRWRQGSDDFGADPEAPPAPAPALVVAPPPSPVVAATIATPPPAVQTPPAATPPPGGAV